MNRSDTEQKDASRAVDSTITNTRLTGPWLMIARTVWLVLVVPSVVLFVVSLFVTYQQLQSGAIPASAQQMLSSVGLSVSGFNTLNTIINVLTSAIWYMVGFLIFWRRSDDWLALLAAFVLVMFNVGPWSNNSVPSTLALAYPTLTLPLSLISFLWDSSLGVFLLLFPGGRLVPRWMGLILLLYLIQAFLGNFPSPSSPFDAFIVTAIIWPAALLLIPISIGFSILRYRLYDIDLLINRTLVYGTLTILLALVYFGLIFALQYLLRGIISQNSDVAIVVSTLVIAAIFQPLRHRIQAIIDRRFYRRKYDAAKIVESFSAKLRNEVDLSQLSEELVAVVQETMQPTHVSLWLRKSSNERKPDTQVE